MNRKVRTLLVFPMLLALFLATVQEADPYTHLDRWQVLEKNGKTLIGPKAEGMIETAFHDGLARVKVDRRVGFIDKQGNWVIRPKSVDDHLTNPRNFSEGLLARRYLGDRATNPDYTSMSFGYINHSGKIVIEPYRKVLSRTEEEICTAAYDFSEGLALIRKDTVTLSSGGLRGTNYSFLDKNGNTAISLSKDMLAIEPNLQNDFAPYDCEDKREQGFGAGEDCERRAKGSSFSNGFALVTFKGKYGFIDRNGKWLGRTYDDAAPFNEGLAFVQDGDKFGFIDTKGKLVFTLPAKPKPCPASFHEGLCKLVRVDGAYVTYGYIDRTGKELIPLKIPNHSYLNIRDFSNGLALITLKGNPPKHGYIDKKGNWKIPAKSGWKPHNFSEGLARVEFETIDNDTVGGYIDTNGKMVWKTNTFWGTDCLGGMMALVVP